MNRLKREFAYSEYACRHFVSNRSLQKKVPRLFQVDPRLLLVRICAGCFVASYVCGVYEC
jgi:hypothetical protein